MSSYPEMVRPFLLLVLATALHAESAAERRAAYPQQFALTDLARSAPPEFAAWGLLRLLDVGAIPTSSWQIDLANEAMSLSASVPQRLPRRLAPGITALDNRAVLVHTASGLGLDSLTLSLRAIAHLRRLDRSAAEKAFTQLPRPAPVPSECKDALLDDTSGWYDLSYRIDAPPLPIVQSIQSHAELAPAIDLILRRNSSSEELELLTGALGQKLRTLPPSSRAFNAAIFETPSKLAHLRTILINRQLPTAALDDGWRAWMQSGLETPACQESRDAGPQQQAVHDAFNLFNKTLAAPLSPELLRPAGEAVAANLERFADNDATRQQSQLFKQLLFSTESRALSPAEKDTPEWRERMQSFIQSIERRTRAADESDVEYFYRQSQLWGGVVMASTPGPIRDRAIQQSIAFFLANAQHIDSAVWFAQVTELASRSRTLHGDDVTKVLNALHATSHPVLQLYAELESRYPSRPSVKAF